MNTNMPPNTPPNITNPSTQMNATAPSNIRYRILNPALNPPQVVFEHNDEQATLRDYAARHDAHMQGLIIAKSEDNGMSWVGVQVRAPDVAMPLAAQAAAAAGPSPLGLTPSVGSVTAGQAAAAVPGSPVSFTPATQPQTSSSVTAPPVVSPSGRLETETDHSEKDHSENRGSTKHRK